MVDRFGLCNRIVSKGEGVESTSVTKVKDSSKTEVGMTESGRGQVRCRKDRVGVVYVERVTRPSDE